MKKRKFIKKVILGAIILGVVGFAVSWYVSKKCTFKCEIAEIGELKNSAETVGFFVRDEEILTVPEPYKKENLKYMYSDGEKIACHSAFAEVYASEDKASESYMIDNINSEIETLEELGDKKYNISKALSAVNSQVDSEINNLFSSIGNSEISQIQNIKKKLRYILSERQIILGKNVDFTKKIQDLKDEKTKISSGKVEPSEVLKAPYSGELISSTDGYEKSIDYKNILNTDFEKIDIENISPQSNEKNCIGKIIKSESWYAVCDLDADMSSYVAAGTEININIPSLGPEKYFPARVESVRKHSSGKKITVVISCNYMNKEFANLRKENLKITFDNFKGVTVKSSALHKSSENESDFGVYVKVGNYLKWKSVKPLSVNKDVVVCKYDAEEYVNEDYLQPGDNVVVSGNDLYIGKKIS
ncbi:MAG: hypothetical protein IKE41_00390 [Clostridia bacterium]|nr:hypothetical protein [Clostridia bacterium]